MSSDCHPIAEMTNELFNKTEAEKLYTEFDEDDDNNNHDVDDYDYHEDFFDSLDDTIHNNSLLLLNSMASNQQISYSNAVSLWSKRDAIKEKIQQGCRRIKTSITAVCARKKMQHTDSNKYELVLSDRDSIGSSTQDPKELPRYALATWGATEDNLLPKKSSIESVELSPSNNTEVIAEEENWILTYFIKFSVWTGKLWWSFLVWLELNVWLEKILSAFNNQIILFVTLLWNIIKQAFKFAFDYFTKLMSKSEKSVDQSIQKTAKVDYLNITQTTAITIWEWSYIARRLFVILSCLVLDLFYQFFWVNIHICVCIVHFLFKIAIDTCVTFFMMPTATSVLCFFDFEEKMQEYIMLKSFVLVKDSSYLAWKIRHYLVLGITSITKTDVRLFYMRLILAKVVFRLFIFRQLYKSLKTFISDMFEILTFLYFLLELVTNIISTLATVIACTAYYLYYVSYAFQIFINGLTSLTLFIQTVAKYLQRTPRKRSF